MGVSIEGVCLERREGDWSFGGFGEGFLSKSGERVVVSTPKRERGFGSLTLWEAGVQCAGGGSGLGG